MRLTPLPKATFAGSTFARYALGPSVVETASVELSDGLFPHWLVRANAKQTPEPATHRLVRVQRTS